MLNNSKLVVYMTIIRFHWSYTCLLSCFLAAGMPIVSPITGCPMGTALVENKLIKKMTSDLHNAALLLYFVRETSK
jgi:hypothetical protein